MKLQVPWKAGNVLNIAAIGFSRKTVKVKVKGKFVPVLNQAPRHEDVWGSGGIAPCILNLGTRWR
jgi:hypothetical protein